MANRKTPGSGRIAGTPNKVTATARERFKQLMDNYSIEKMQEDVNSLTPKDRLTFIADIAEYVIPKLQRTEISGRVNNKLILEIVRKYPIINELPPSTPTEGSE